MSESLNKKIIELENKFSVLISKYKKLETINENLKKEITDREIDLILYKFNNANNSNLEILSSDEKSKLKDDIDSTIEELDTIIDEDGPIFVECEYESSQYIGPRLMQNKSGILEQLRMVPEIKNQQINKKLDELLK